MKLGLALTTIIFACQAAHAQTGCTDPAATNYSASAAYNDGSCTYAAITINPVLKGKLASVLSSSSGVVWTDGNLWTHNDSGNPPDIYRIDTSNGKTLQTVVIDNYPNTDWEDITADADYIYVSDCGNNNGDRRDQKILKIAKTDITIGSSTVHVNAQAISVTYADQTSYAASSTNNFDCESVISINDSLYLFTKDRGDLSTRVYKLPKVPGAYTVAPITSYNVNGLITGADYDPTNREVVLIGYMSGHINSFMWILDDFQGDMFFSGDKRRVELGNGQEWQTEGVAYITPGRFFISNETAGSIDASLFVTEKEWPLPPYSPAPNAVNNINAPKITYYPEPTTGLLHMNNITVKGTYIIRDMQGRTAQRGLLNAGSNYLDVNGLRPANYIMEVYNEDGTTAGVKITKE